MPGKYLQRWLPSSADVQKYWLLRQLGSRLHHPRLWRLNRRSVSGATGIGLFVAFIPVPFQMVLASLGALWFRVNLPLSVALIFITNPLTMGPVYYACYKLGAWMLESPVVSTGDNFKPSIEWLFGQVAIIWQPLLAGSLVAGVVSGILGYCLVQLAWRAYVIRKRESLLRR